MERLYGSCPAPGYRDKATEKPKRGKSKATKLNDRLRELADRDGYLSTLKVATMFGVSQKGIQKAIQDRRILFRQVGHQYFVHPGDYTRYAEAVKETRKKAALHMVEVNKAKAEGVKDG